MATGTATPPSSTAVNTAPDPAIEGKGYAHPEVLVTTTWLAEHLNDPKVRVLESNEDVLLYDTGHIPGAQKIDWHEDLNDAVVRDYVSREQFQALLRRLGIDDSTTVIFYGDKNNWWAAYALWVFHLFGFTKTKILDGGRLKWEAESRPTTTDKPRYPATQYVAKERSDSEIRAFFQDVKAHLAKRGKLVDVRSPQEYTGERTHMPEYPQEGTLRGGHIPTAKSIPWARAANRGWDVQVGERPARDIRAGAGAKACGRRDCVLPYRGTLIAHLVRIDLPSRLQERAQLRW